MHLADEIVGRNRRHKLDSRFRGPRAASRVYRPATIALVAIYPIMKP